MEEKKEGEKLIIEGDFNARIEEEGGAAKEKKY